MYARSGSLRSALQRLTSHPEMPLRKHRRNRMRKEMRQTTNPQGQIPQPKKSIQALTYPQQPCPSSTTTSAPKATPTLCGSRGLAPCAPKQSCIADPNNLGCSLIADCPGFCVVLNGPACGGFAGLKCPQADQVCVDDPRDSCGGSGSADCIGVCVRLDGSSSA